MTAHPELPTLEADIKNPAFVEEGKGLFESVGCKGCHAIEPDQYGTPVGVAEGFKPTEARTTKDFAPNLSKIAEKTSASWIYTWLKNPRDFSPHTAMPSLRLTDHEAEALTAFLMTHGEKKEDAGVDDCAQGSREYQEGRSAGAQVRMLRMPRDRRDGQGVAHRRRADDVWLEASRRIVFRQPDQHPRDLGSTGRSTNCRRRASTRPRTSSS